MLVLSCCLYCIVFFTLSKTSIFCDTTIVYLYLFPLNCDQSKCYILQCRSKGNISGGACERRRRKPLGGSGGMLPQKILKSRGLECYFQRSPRAICDLHILQIIFFVCCLSKPMHIESITLETPITK